MVQRLNDIFERFPEDVDAVRCMILEDNDFNVMCDVYRDIAEEICKLEVVGGNKAISTINGLKMRRIALEEDILSKIEGYNPI